MARIRRRQLHFDCWASSGRRHGAAASEPLPTCLSRINAQWTGWKCCITRAEQCHSCQLLEVDMQGIDQWEKHHDTLAEANEFVDKVVTLVAVPRGAGALVSDAPRWAKQYEIEAPTNATTRVRPCGHSPGDATPLLPTRCHIGLFFPWPRRGERRRREGYYYSPWTKCDSGRQEHARRLTYSRADCPRLPSLAEQG